METSRAVRDLFSADDEAGFYSRHDVEVTLKKNCFVQLVGTSRTGTCTLILLIKLCTYSITLSFYQPHHFHDKEPAKHCILSPDTSPSKASTLYPY